MISGFRAARILWDYLEDAKLLVRLNQVMRRVGLETLPACIAQVLPEARGIVNHLAGELLSSNAGYIEEGTQHPPRERACPGRR